ncbi:hypothetical protein ASF94_11760 [Acidovorax sp. Leaf160]|nr:hypothetical protein ASF94_11760 [Acidovorax sp. Leaf160]
MQVLVQVLVLVLVQQAPYYRHHRRSLRSVRPTAAPATKDWFFAVINFLPHIMKAKKRYRMLQKNVTIIACDRSEVWWVVRPFVSNEVL